MESRVSGHVIAAGVCHHSSNIFFGLITCIFLRKWLHSDFVGFGDRYGFELLFETGYFAGTIYKPLQNQRGAIKIMLIPSLKTERKALDA